MAVISQQNPDGTWTEAVPLKGTRLYRAECWLRKHHCGLLANVLTTYDEWWLR